MNDKNKNYESYNILRILEKKPDTNQRDLAKIFNLSLGKIHYILKELNNKGIIKVKNFKKNQNKINYVYLITPKGLKHKTRLAYFFLKKISKEYDELKKDIKKTQ
jgi:EPS-associated MarR family transcriptional regulator